MNFILLVGTNPLPNYVTALFLKDEVDKIMQSSLSPMALGEIMASTVILLRTSNICEILARGHGF